VFSWPPQLLVIFLRIKLIFKPRITLHPSEKVHTAMTEEMPHVLQSVFAEVCLREHCIMGRLLHWVCCIYISIRNFEIKILIFVIVCYMKQRKPITLNRGHLFQNMTSIFPIPYSHIVLHILVQNISFWFGVNTTVVGSALNTPKECSLL